MTDKFDKTLYQHVLDLFKERKVRLVDLAQLVLDGQKPYVENITYDQCLHAVKKVLKKREIQNAIITGVELDKQVDQGTMIDPYLKAILHDDSGQYQVDELVSTACNGVFGGISSSNRGFLDKAKPGIIGEVDSRTKTCNVFLDDLLAGIVASAEAYLANKQPTGAYQLMEK